jgi:hypothetical protein
MDANSQEKFRTLLALPSPHRLQTVSPAKALAPHLALTLTQTPLSQYIQRAGWSSPVARWAHNPKVVGSNPTPATNQISGLEKIEISDSLPLTPIRKTSKLGARFQRLEHHFYNLPVAKHFFGPRGLVDAYFDVVLTSEDGVLYVTLLSRQPANRWMSDAVSVRSVITLKTHPECEPSRSPLHGPRCRSFLAVLNSGDFPCASLASREEV